MLLCAGSAVAHTALLRCRGAVRAGNDSPQIPPPTGAPAIVVPMGFTNGSRHAPLPTSLHVRSHVLGRLTGVMPSMRSLCGE